MKGFTMQITKSGHAYLATQYEQAVDAGMDVEAIRRHLHHLGIIRSPAQLRHDLDHTYAFAGYWSSHPAPPPPDVVVLDKAIDQMTTKQLNLHSLADAPVLRKRVYVRALARRQAAGQEA
jgi:hypothetical protein